MKIFLVLSKQTIADGEFYATPFKTRAEAIDFMEELTMKKQNEWDDKDYTIFEDADYFECVARIEEEDM